MTGKLGKYEADRHRETVKSFKLYGEKILWMSTLGIFKIFFLFNQVYIFQFLNKF